MLIHWPFSAERVGLIFWSENGITTGVLLIIECSFPQLRQVNLGRLKDELSLWLIVTVLYCRENKNLAVFVFPSHTIIKLNSCMYVPWTLCDAWIARLEVQYPPVADYVSPWPSLAFHSPLSYDWCMVRTSPPSLAGMVCLFKLNSEQGLFSTQNRCCMDLWLAWLVFTYRHHHQQQLTLHQIPRERVSWLLYSLSLACLQISFLAA